MKYRVEVTQKGQQLQIEVWYYVQESHDNPWVLVSSLIYENGVPQGR